AKKTTGSSHSSCCCHLCRCTLGRVLVGGRSKLLRRNARGTGSVGAVCCTSGSGRFPAQGFFVSSVVTLHVHRSDNEWLVNPLVEFSCHRTIRKGTRECRIQSGANACRRRDWT